MFAASGILFSRIRVADVHDGSTLQDEPSTWRQLREGWGEFTQRQWVWVVVLQFMIVNASLTGGIARTLGIRDFELDTQGSGVSTSVVASGRLSERLSLRYGVGVFEPANTFALRYELTRRLYLEVASGLASSLDLFYRRDF